MTPTAPAPAAPAGRMASRSVLHTLGIDPPGLHALEKTLLLLAAVMTAISFSVGLTDVTGRYGGIDIRNRVVGARVQAAGMDPYTFRWEPGTPETLLDPVHFEDVPRLTIPPTGVCLYRAVSWMPYGSIRVVHYALEWACLAAAVWVLVPLVPRRGRVAFVVVVGVLVASGAFWRMHTERGQLYVLHLLLLSVAARRALRTGLDSWWAGVALGLAAALRPSFAPVGVAFLVLGKLRTAFGTFATGAVAVGLTLPFTGVGVWKSYSVMGDVYYRSLSNPDEFSKVWELPSTAEGFWFGSTIVDPASPSSSLARFYMVNRLGLGLPLLDLGKVSKAATLGVFGMLFLALLVYRRRSPRATLLLISVALLDAEYFLPHRWPYVDIHWLLPLALAAPYLAGPRAVPQFALACVLGGLWIGNDLLLVTHSHTTTLARTYLLAAGLTGVAAWVYFRPKRRAVGPALGATAGIGKVSGKKTNPEGTSPVNHVIRRAGTRQK